jgi:hypothetical protein
VDCFGGTDRGDIPGAHLELMPFGRVVLPGFPSAAVRPESTFDVATPRSQIDDETARDGPGRTPGDDSALQRGWPNPYGQRFGQVTSRTRQPR